MQNLINQLSIWFTTNKANEKIKDFSCKCKEEAFNLVEYLKSTKSNGVGLASFTK